MQRFTGVLRETRDIILCMAILFIKVISLNLSANLLRYTNGYLILGVIGSVLTISSLMLIFKKKNRFKAFIIINFIITLIVYTDIVYNRYFQDVTSIALIYQARIAGEVKDSIFALIKFSDIRFFVDIILFTVLYFIRRKKTVEDENTKLSFRLSMCSIFLVAGIVFSSLSVNALDREQPGLIKTFYDKKYIVSRIGTINYHAYDIYRFAVNRVFNANRLTSDEKDTAQAWIENKNSVEAKQYNGIMKGKNLIVVQLEAFQSFVLNGRVSGQEVTPNLNKLARESIVFNNYYYQTAWGGTSDAEFLSNVSLLPAREGSVYYQYSGNTYDSLISQLKGQGYFTSVMHPNRPGFWNRTNMYNSLGFDEYDSEEDFIIDEVQGLGLSDKSFFKQAISKMEKHQEPFYSFLISLSSHFPYKDQEDKIRDIMDVGEFEGTVMGDYLKAVRYTDEAIGEFIEGLKQAGLWDNSVVVFYGDHAAMQSDKKELVAKLVNGGKELSPLEWFEEQKVVAMIHIPGEEIKGNVDKTAGQMDLFPTLANLFGVEAKYALGQDLLNSDEGFVVTRDGNWVYEDAVYLKSLDKVFDRITGKELNREDFKTQFEKALEYLENSDAIIENNLIKYFRGLSH